MRAEPKTILYFLWNYFDVLKDLFELQNREGVIRTERLVAICRNHGHDVQPKLIEYKILRRNGPDWEIRSVYYSLIEYILHEFKPLLPETIEKYHFAITELFRKIRAGINDDNNILLHRIADLSIQIREFLEVVEKNALRLLHETRELKSNARKLEYREKVEKASFWIEHYIMPLNKILDINQPQSTANKLYEISEYVNRRRLNFSNEKIRLEFEKMYNLLVQTNDDLLIQSKILTNELLPLIERLRTESIVLSGWIKFLRNPYKVKTPAILKAHRASTMSKDTYYNTREFFEQFITEPVVLVDDTPLDTDRFIFDREAYKQKMTASLPIDNFFIWASQTVEQDFKTLETDKFFSMMSLLFEDDVVLELGKDGKYTKLKTTESTLKVPHLTVLPNGIS